MTLVQRTTESTKCLSRDRRPLPGDLVVFGSVRAVHVTRARLRTVKMPGGSTLRQCTHCLEKINCANRRCPKCGKLLGMKSRQTARMKAFRTRAKEWARNVKKSHNQAKIFDNSALLVEKLKALGYFPLLLWGKYRPQNKKWIVQLQCPFELPVVVHEVLEKIVWLFEGLLEACDPERVEMGQQERTGDDEAEGDQSGRGEHREIGQTERREMLDAWIDRGEMEGQKDFEELILMDIEEMEADKKRQHTEEVGKKETEAKKKVVAANRRCEEPEEAEDSEDKTSGPSSPRSASLTAMSPFNLITILQSASSPSDSIPVISKVTSDPTPKRTKRSPGLSQSKPVQRARPLYEYCSNIPGSPSISAATSDVITSLLTVADIDGIKVIEETNSTPITKPFDLSKVKMEEKTSDDAPSLYIESSDHGSIKPETENTRKERMETSTFNGQTSIKTQTECLIVKVEKDEQIRKEEVEIKEEETESDVWMEQSTNEAESRIKNNTEIIKGPMEVERCSGIEVSGLNLKRLEEIPKETKISFEQHEKSNVENQEDMTYITHFNTFSVQSTHCIKEIMKERDELKIKHEVLLQIKVEKEAQDKVFCDRFKAEGQEHSSTTNENVDDKLALQMDLLQRELEKCNDECNELRRKLESLEQENVCELLQKEVEELRKQREEWINAREPETMKDNNTSSGQTCRASTAANLDNGFKKEEKSSERPEEGENSVTLAKLRELRCSIARLLVTFVPALDLDLDQVNYDCEVIDEILKQVIQEIYPAETAFNC
ncbi:LOW QUALITY PROTEIN: MORC family CW-type zinc finger protein 3-like [Puntigrus tetrazona]|uniref:LOW QUALITY PROTEIN: MORC family CW-type zinc finger protein 3-like n=1 Tax=Puntigrus tetrazona TaxID=1606681 RepID=UPI001C895677|nr:LOW QUALITY PROTEIN: MORC family CW-type zinc finger protein 3-like [Puntigrus tetrazona]